VDRVTAAPIKQENTFGMPNTLPSLEQSAVVGRLWLAFCGLFLLSISCFPALIPRKLGAPLFVIMWLALPAKDFLLRSTRRNASKIDTHVDSRIKLYVVVIVTFSACFVFWARKIGLSWQETLGLLLLMEALSSFVVSLTEWWRLSTVGLSVTLMICGFGLPFVSNLGLLFGLAILAGSLLSAGILRCQLRMAAEFQSRK
jgi:hypothetical protein